MATTTEAFTEFCLIGVSREQGTLVEQQFAALTEDITGMEFGEKDVEGIPTVSGGRIIKKVSMTDESVTMKMYPISASLDGDGVVGNFHPQSVVDSADPIVVQNTNLRNRHKVVFLWSTNLPTAASTVTVAGAQSYRIQVINAYMTKYTPSFDDKILSAEVTFKWAPFNKAGIGNKREESASTAALAAATASATSWTIP